MVLSSAPVVDTTNQNRRKSPRTKVPSIEIEVGGIRYVSEDWGLGGCRVSSYTGHLRSGDTVGIKLFLKIGREHQGLVVKAEVVRFDQEQNNALAFRFVDLDAEDMKNFCKSVEAELRGQVSGRE